MKPASENSSFPIPMLSELKARSGGNCELCAASGATDIYPVEPAAGDQAARHILCCAVCLQQLEPDASPNEHHLRCLSTSMWSEVEAVQVVAWRLLTKLSQLDWAHSLLDTLYLEESSLAWARSLAMESPSASDVIHRDSNGTPLQAGDTVTLIKDLVVKGAGFTAKRGTAVRGIELVEDRAEHIEGRVQGQQIVILTEFVKRST